MSARTMFWFAVVTLTVVCSANALPMVADEDSRPPIYVVENLDSPKQKVEQQVDGTVTSPVLKTEVETVPSVDGENYDAKDATIQTDPNEVSDQVPEKLAPVPVVPDVEQTESVTGTEPPSSDAKPVLTSVPVQTEPITKPNLNKNAEQTVRPEVPNIPFFLEFFQPSQPYQSVQSVQPFQLFQSFGSNHQQQPSRHQPIIPFGAPIDPFPMHQPFSQMVDAYTNEFRTPEVLILKPKRNVRVNTTGMPPIPFLMNIMLNAFRHDPSDMLTLFNKMSMSQMDNVPNFGDAQGESDQPVKKTTSKIEIIDGHRVQINETTVTIVNGNHKSFNHYKEMLVLPQETNEKTSNEQLTSVVNVNSDTQDVVLGGLKDGPTAANASESVPLDDHFQAASANDYAPRYRFRPHVSAMDWISYDPMYPTPNKGSEPEPETSTGLLHDTDVNDKINSSRLSGGSEKLQVQVTTVDPSTDPTTEPEPELQIIDQNHDAFNQMKWDKNKDFTIRPEVEVSLSNDTLVNEWIEKMFKASGEKLPEDVELVFADDNGQPGA